MPIQGNMKNKHRFPYILIAALSMIAVGMAALYVIAYWFYLLNFHKLLTLTLYYCCFVVLFIFVYFLKSGCMGYLAFGKNVSDVITKNLPENTLTMLVKIALCISLLFT